MARTITILDQYPIGQVSQKIELVVQDERITVRDLIRQRIHQEVSLYNTSTPGYFQGLVQPKEAELTLNGYKLRKKRKINWEEQARLAVQAFRTKSFTIQVGDKKVENLEEFIPDVRDTQVSFAISVPIIGG